MSNNIRTYSELMSLETYEERFKYLMLSGRVGEESFGFDRYLNQQLYRSNEWKNIRERVILRDNACDLGLDGYDIFGTIHIHHMNPISSRDIIESSDYLLNTEFLVCVSIDTHNAIHYGSNDYPDRNKIADRKVNDHCPWKR